jgi:hypothetical protein
MVRVATVQRLRAGHGMATGMLIKRHRACAHQSPSGWRFTTRVRWRIMNRPVPIAGVDSLGRSFMKRGVEAEAAFQDGRRARSPTGNVSTPFC